MTQLNSKLELKNTQKTVLILGYGNPIRGDDGIGQAVATQVETWNLPNVRSLALHQLTPELAETLSQVDMAIFVDASLEGETVKVSALEPVNSTELKWGHYLNPKSLLSLAEALYGKQPKAWLIAVPGINFELCDRLSPEAEKGVITALKIIQNLLN